MAVYLQESAVAHLDDLPPDGPPHLACQVQAGIGLIHGVALWAGEVDEMTAVFQHFCAAGLLTRPMTEHWTPIRQALLWIGISGAGQGSQAQSILFFAN